MVLPVEIEALVYAWTQFVMPSLAIQKAGLLNLSTSHREQHRQAASAFFDDDFPFRLQYASSSSSNAHQDASARSPSDEYLHPQVRHARRLSHVEGLEYVGGLDISFDPTGGDEAIAVLAVLSWPALELIYSKSKKVKLTVAYIPSFLSFREAAPLAALVLEAEPTPQLLFVDGNARFHIREAGSGVAIGLLTGIPTIGVAKEYHPLDTKTSATGTPDTSFRSSQKGMRDTCRSLLTDRGSWISLPRSATDATPLGAVRPWLPHPSLSRPSHLLVRQALLTSPSPSSSRPVFVSSGHRISLKSSIALTLASSTKARVPEPIRQADAIGRAEANRFWGVATETPVQEMSSRKLL